MTFFFDIVRDLPYFSIITVLFTLAKYNTAFTKILEKYYSLLVSIGKNVKATMFLF